MKIQEMGILPLLPTLLNPQSSCTPKVANIIAEVAKNGELHFVIHPLKNSHLSCYYFVVERQGRGGGSSYMTTERNCGICVLYI